MGPELLRPDNFTPAVRTPWGGDRICGRLKAGLELPSGATRVGEAWEISVEPSFPSRLARTGELLADVIAADPVGWLGQSAACRHGGQTPLLVKLLDAGDDLSVQVHPRDDDPALGANEGGKPESWIVVEASAGAGIWLGWREGVDRGAVERRLAAGGPLDELMTFVPVRSGDVFAIAAGTPHAIGRGVTLVEPQFVAPGRVGVTYRFWDWNRRYDAAGHPSPDGQPRTLHVERSLAVTDWQAPRGEAFVESCRPPTRILAAEPVRRELVLAWPWFCVERWHGSGELRVGAPGTMTALVCLGGAAQIHAAGQVSVRSGQSCVVPASAGELVVHARDAVLVAVRSP